MSLTPQTQPRAANGRFTKSTSVIARSGSDADRASNAERIPSPPPLALQGSRSIVSGAKGITPSDIPMKGQTVSKPPSGQGIFTNVFSSYVPKIQDPLLYEYLREAIPMLDTAVARYSELDGFVEIECNTDAAQRIADEWAESVQVNDTQLGLQAAFAQWTGEIYEQGFGVMEWVANEKRNGIARLLVADSKKFWFLRSDDTGLDVYYQPDLRVTRNQGAPNDQVRKLIQPLWAQSAFNAFNHTKAVKLGMSNKIIGHNRPENQDPHGVSILRSIPFVAKTMSTINNAVANVWERFGDPSYNATYKAKKKKSEAQLTAINAKLAADIKAVVAAKRAGQSADIVNSIGGDDDLTIEILGASGQVIDVGPPGALTIDQIVSGVGLSYSLLSLAPPKGKADDKALSSALFAARRRFRFYAPLLRRPVAAHFALRGLRVKPEEWRLKQQQPNYDDILKLSQARFMDAQRIAVYGVRFKDDPPDMKKPDPKDSGTAEGTAEQSGEAADTGSVDIDVMTINERRELQGLPPLDGGDAIYMPSSQIPVIEIEEEK